MSWIFSKRCKKLINNKTIKVHLPKKVRVRILKLLEEFDEFYEESSSTGFMYSTSLLEELTKILKSEHGIEKLYSYPEKEDGDAKPGSLQDFVLRGNFPPYIFDILEIFFTQITNKEDKYRYQSDFNSIMEENDLQWRMAEGKIFPIDSQYIEEEIVQKTYYLLKQVKFYGALKEFEQARIDFTNGNYNSTIRNASLSFESTIKEILTIEKEKPGKLFRLLMDSGYIPEYYQGFLKDFEENILRCPSIMRNEELGVGHGIGPSENVIPSELAELAINLTASLINYLVKCYTNKENPEELNQKNESNKEDEEDIPF